MKKIFKTIIKLAVLLSVGLSSGALNVSAMVVENGKIYWTLDELKEVAVEMENKATEACGEDFSCRKNIYKNLIESSNKVYRAAHLVSGKRIIVSSINPSTSTIKVIYQGLPALIYRTETTVPDNLKELYMMWVDPEMAYVTQKFETLTEYLKSDGSIEGIHLIYQGQVESGYLAELGQEMTIVAPSGSDFMDDSQSIISYQEVHEGKVGDLNGTWGSIRYNDCMARKGYEFGAECEAMFSWDGYPAFFPVIEAKNDDEEETLEESKDDDTDEEDTADEEEKPAETKEEPEEDKVEESTEEDQPEESTEETKEDTKVEESEGESEEQIDEPAPEEEDEKVEKTMKTKKIEENKTAEGSEESGKGEETGREVLAPETGHQHEGAIAVSGGCIIMAICFGVFVGLKKTIKRTKSKDF